MTFEQFIDEWHNDKDFIIAKTSGSTGQPKEIMLPKNFVKESAIRTNTFFGINKDSHLHSCISPDTIGGKMMAVRSVIADAIFSYESPSNQPLKAFDSEFTIDLVSVVPSQVLFILDNIDFLPKINNLLIGGSSIHPELRKKISRSRLKAYESYGMTETASHIALRKILDIETPFTLLPGIEVTLDERNCLCISFGDKTFIQTNDIAEIISNKEFIIKGRKDDVIISGGKKINPYEIEKKLYNIINRPFLVTGFPNEKWGEKVVMIIEGLPVLPQIEEKIAPLLEKWEMPKEILYVKELPRTSNGKLRRIKSPLFLSFFDSDNNLVF